MKQTTHSTGQNMFTFCDYLYFLSCYCYDNFNNDFESLILSEQDQPFFYVTVYVDDFLQTFSISFKNLEDYAERR